MTSIIREVEIFDVKANDFTLADLYDGISSNHLNDFETNWKPILESESQAVIKKHTGSNGKINRQSAIDELGDLNIQDAGWKWRDKIIAYPQPSIYYNFYTLECNGHAQGLMAIDLAKKRGHIKSQLNQHLVYVEYLAVAPWNRPQLFNPPAYKLIGRVMIATAISISINEGFKGRIGLHSLPQADSFYNDKCGMVALGPDPSKDDLIYFEMTPEKANDYLKNR